MKRNYLTETMIIVFAGEIKDQCTGESKAYLEGICHMLPDKDCLPGMVDMKDSMCGEDEYYCGDGQCIHGLGVCDHKYQCENGADELPW